MGDAEERAQVLEDQEWWKQYVPFGWSLIGWTDRETALLRAPDESTALTIDARVVALLDDHQLGTRDSHARLCRGIKGVLGFDNWPTIKGDFTSGVVKLLEEHDNEIRVERSRLEVVEACWKDFKRMCTERGFDHGKGYRGGIVRWAQDKIDGKSEQE